MTGARLHGVVLVPCPGNHTQVHGSIPLYLKKLEAVSTIKWGIQGIVSCDVEAKFYSACGADLEVSIVPSGVHRFLLGCMSVLARCKD